MAVKFLLADTKNLRRKIAQLQREMPKEVERAVRMEAEVEATESKRRTPVDTGALRASIHVEGPVMEGKAIGAAIVAGGVAAPYALAVHEDMDAYHAVGQAKFIESTLKESAPFLPQRIAKRLRSFLFNKGEM